MCRPKERIIFALVAKELKRSSKGKYKSPKKPYSCINRLIVWQWLWLILILINMVAMPRNANGSFNQLQFLIPIPVRHPFKLENGTQNFRINYNKSKKWQNTSTKLHLDFDLRSATTKNNVDCWTALIFGAKKQSFVWYNKGLASTIQSTILDKEQKPHNKFRRNETEKPTKLLSDESIFLSLPTLLVRCYLSALCFLHLRRTYGVYLWETTV